MSVEATCKTSIKDQPALVEALEAIYGKGTISVEETGTKVKGFRSAKTPTILVNIPGLYGTAGFYKNKDGVYELVYDSTDKRKLKEVIPHTEGKLKVDKLNQTYATILLKKKLQQMRGRVVQESTDENGVIRIKAHVSNY